MASGWASDSAVQEQIKNRPHSAAITGAAVKTASYAETGAEYNDSAHHHFIAED